MAKANPPSYVESTEMLDAAPEEQQLSQPLSSEADPDAELAMASQALVPQRNIPQSNMNPNIMQEAGSAGNQMRLAANMGEAVGNIARGIAGGDQSSDVGGQFYQNAITASYSPQKMAEDMQQFEAKTLAVTAARYELEERDPTSEINRRYQKSIKPFLDKAGLGYLSDFVTIADMGPGGIYQAMQAAKARAEEASTKSMLLMQRLEATGDQKELDRESREGIAKMKAKKGGGSGGGTGSKHGSLPPGFDSYGAFEEDFRQKFAKLQQAIHSGDVATQDAIRGELSGTSIYLDPKSKLGANYLRQAPNTVGQLASGSLFEAGQSTQGIKHGSLSRQQLAKEAERYGKEMGKIQPLLSRINGVEELINKSSNAQIIFGQAVQGKLPPAILNQLPGGKQTQEVIQRLGSLTVAELKEISGAAVTEEEAQRFMTARGRAFGADKTSAQQGLAEMKSLLKEWQQRLDSSSLPEVKDYYRLGGDPAKQEKFLQDRQRNASGKVPVLFKKKGEDTARQGSMSPEQIKKAREDGHTITEL